MRSEVKFASRQYLRTVDGDVMSQKLMQLKVQNL